MNTLLLLKAMSRIASNCKLLGSLSNHDDDGNENPTNLHI